MDKKRLKLGVIGVGRIAMAHLNAAMDLRDQVELWLSLTFVPIGLKTLPGNSE